MRNAVIHVCALLLASFAVRSQNTLTVTVRTHNADCQLASAGLNIQGGVAPYEIQWSHGAVGDTVSSLNPGDYWVTVIDNGTPKDTATVHFTIDPVSCKVTFNNRFTPNGDGINDTWGISRANEYPNFLLQVFDRWGQLVHQQRGQYTPWDGTHLGAKVPEATYYYIFFYEESKTGKIEKGDVTIVR